MTPWDRVYDFPAIGITGINIPRQIDAELMSALSYSVGLYTGWLRYRVLQQLYRLAGDVYERGKTR